MTNIVYAAKIVSAEDEPELYARLEASYPAKWSGTASKILSINGSVGLDGIIEFDDLDVADL
jgi:hypothetical protein